MRKDEFKVFEDYIVKLVGSHKISIYLIFMILSVWLIFSISVISMLGYVGGSYVEKNMEERHVNGILGDKEYNMWENIVMPVIMMAFETMKWFGLSIGALFITLSIYFSIRAVYKQNRENL
jgi:hypothetical protein